MIKKGIITVVSAPSGCGKNTIIEEASKNRDNFAYVTSATTREIRAGEAEGINYFYKTEKEFNHLIEIGEILEWDIFCNCKYGTLKSQITEKINSGKDLLLDLTISGALAVKEAFPDDTITVFILPPSIDELRRRLSLRGREDEKQIEERIKAAVKDEIPQVCKFDYVIVNDDLNKASEDLLAIIDAKRLDYKRNMDILNELGLKGDIL